MQYLNALDAVIERGIAGVKESYKDEPHKRDGSIEGFRACRDKTPGELFEILKTAGERTKQARDDHHNGKISIQEYWKIRYAEVQIEWVCNCVSVMLMNQGQTSPFPRHVGPTARAASLVASIVGVASPN
jgi:hypothetical protein